MIMWQGKFHSINSQQKWHPRSVTKEIWQTDVSYYQIISIIKKWTKPSLTDDKAVIVQGELYQVVLEDK